MDSAASIAPQRLSQAELARQTGVSRQAINDLVGRGILVPDGDGLLELEAARLAIANGVSPTSKTSQAIGTAVVPAAAAAGTPAATPAPEGGITFHTARTLNEVALARMNSLKARQLEGELVPTSDVRAAIGSKYSSAREAFMQMGPRLAPVIVGLGGDQQRIQDAIDAEVQQCLEHLIRASDSLANLANVVAP